MSKKPMKYYVVDAFTELPFKGNPAAVCLLDEEEEVKGDDWLQSLAAEFNIPVTCYLIPIHGTSKSNPHFRLRWFTSIVEVDICAHATLAASHALFSYGLVNNNATIEFVTNSGNLTAKKISVRTNGEASKDAAFYVELNFPVDPITKFKFDDTLVISKALKGASIVDIMRTQIQDDILVVVTSGENVTEIEPLFDEIVKLQGRKISVSGIAPPDSEFDFYHRLFAPKLGVNEDPVCGSIHCSLATYWSKKLGKTDLKSYQTSVRGGAVHVCIDEQNKRVFLRGKAVIVMEGCVLV
ncbi:uncharacterized protein LOC131620336 [Vicia villosa]|uniref:uncharacterized protein LOC131620336 n=1 Tax=Vicia villosa TaxID=3911 RepID=UPI00273CF2E7|nr:uncharacterized protein LOC131620336 [Vicia villosa]